MTVRPMIPILRLDDVSAAYKVACEAYEAASRLGCSYGLDVALWALVEREARIAERGA